MATMVEKAKPVSSGQIDVGIKGVVTPTNVYGSGNTTFDIEEFDDVYMFGILQSYKTTNPSGFGWGNGGSIFLRSGVLISKQSSLLDLSVSENKVTIRTDDTNTQWRLFTIE